MIAGLHDVAQYATGAAYLCGALLSAGAALYVAQVGDRGRRDWLTTIAACSAIALWCVTALAFSPFGVASELAGTVVNLTLIALIFSLFSADGRDESLKPTRPLIAALVLVELCQAVILLIAAELNSASVALQLAFESSVLLSMMMAIGAIVLLHNLYAGATAGSRQAIRRGVIALTGLFAYELNLAMIAWLGGEFPVLLVQFHGLFAGAMAALLALGANGAVAGLQFRPSRVVTFQSLSLLLVSSYILAMLFATRSLALLGGDVARISQALLLVLALLAAVVWLPSQRLRQSLRVIAAKHLFQHRYDYREEWMRFTRTMGQGADADATLSQRAIKAIADMADSPAGILLMPGDDDRFELTARWNWPTLDVPAIAADRGLFDTLQKRAHIIDLDEVRAGIDHHGECADVPGWMEEAKAAWALVPLVHFDRLVGVVVLARPRVARQLDWEDFDLLRVAGQQLASYLSEQAGQQALMDANRFDEFNRRMAFVMHDIKNLASQLSLLSANAQKHADNPDFRADMLVTLKNSSDKLTTLLSRLDRYGKTRASEFRTVDLASLAKDICARFRAVHPVMLVRSEPVRVTVQAEALEQALVHLVQNAIDASGTGDPVQIAVHSEPSSGMIEIVDSGTGMSAEFVRNGLFKPFVSSKENGFGIGAMEAREMIEAMNGSVSVTTREGIGTRFAVALPLVHHDHDTNSARFAHTERAA